MKKETWDTENMHMNMEEAEKDIGRFKHLCPVYKNKGADELDTILGILYRNRPEMKEDVRACVVEMAEILYNKENGIGYHINHITSGKTVYSVYSYDNLKVYGYHGEFSTEAEAVAEAESLPDAYVEEWDGKWLVFSLDDKLTAESKEKREGVGDFIADFDTKEEAEAECSAYKYPEITEFDSEEWWVVVNSRTKKPAFKMLFRSDTTALARLYRLVQPRAFMAYVEKYSTGGSDGE